MKTSLAVFILICAPSLLMAQSIRCGSRIISRGSSSAELAALCGDPTQVNRGSLYNGVANAVPGRPGVVAGSAEQVEVETWTYNFGPNQLMQRVRIQNGLVVEIDSLGYGYNEP
jgi:Protein of unknown function (DUF2845)